jgi:hypothetical protein
MPHRDDNWGSVVGEALGLVPLVGRVVRERVGELVGESRTGLVEALREVKEELRRELDEREAASGAASADTGDEAGESRAAAVPAPPADGAATGGRGSDAATDES